MKKLLSIVLSLCLLMGFMALTASAAALPAEMVSIDGLSGYKVFVYQDFSAAGLTMWTSDAANVYTIADSKCTLTNWGVWTKGKVEQKGQDISNEVFAAAEGFGYYVKANSIGMWAKSTYYIADTNTLNVCVETPYILVPIDGSAPTEGETLQYGQFLIPANFEGYVLIKQKLTDLEGFSPYACIEGNLNVTSNDTAAVYDTFFVWATAQDDESPAPTTAPTEPPTQTGDPANILTAVAGVVALGSLTFMGARKRSK